MDDNHLDNIALFFKHAKYLLDTFLEGQARWAVDALNKSYFKWQTELVA